VENIVKSPPQSARAPLAFGLLMVIDPLGAVKSLDHAGSGVRTRKAVCGV